MNILYIGPYRLSSDDGYESLNALLNIKNSKHSVVARPWYNGSYCNKTPYLESIISSIEKESNIKLDILIQNLPIEYITYTSHIPHNIFWPITEQSIPNLKDIQKYRFLNQHGTIVCTSPISKFIMNHIGIVNSKYVHNDINESMCMRIANKFTLGVYDTYKKYYIIGDNSIEKDIRSTIISFVQNFSEDSCLIVFMQNISQSILDRYHEFIKSVYAGLGIRSTLMKVLVMPIDSDYQTILIAHNTGDVFLQLNSTEHHLNIAKKLNKHTITNSSDYLINRSIPNFYKTGLVEYSKPLNISMGDTTNSPSENILDVIEQLQ